MHTPTPLPAGRSNKLPGFCLKHIISWEIKTLLKALCNKSIKGCAVQSQALPASRSPNSAGGTASSQPQGNNCWDFALKIIPEQGWAGGLSPTKGEKAALYVLCNQHQPCPTAPRETAQASLFIFHKVLIWEQWVDSGFELLLLEPGNNPALAGLQLTLWYKLLARENENMQQAKHKVWAFYPKQHQCSLPASAATAHLEQAQR